MKTLVFTGGHHTSALEVAKVLKDKGYNIIWFGHRYSMWKDRADSAEYKEVIAMGIKFYDLQAGKFHHTHNPLKLIRIPWGFVQAFYWLMHIKPDGVVSFGGYLAVPTVISGWLLGIKSITHEQTATLGWANKIISHFVKKIAVTWPSSLVLYPKDKVVLTGLPLRPGIIKSFKLKIKNLVYITGGKQGSHIINQAVFEALPELIKNYIIIHQTGNSTLYHDFEKSQKFKYSNYQSFDYSSQKAMEALQKASVVITRGGAHIVYELGVLGKKCVIIPIPWVSHNEQYTNAKILADNQQAIILSEKDLTPENLILAIAKAEKLQPAKQTFLTDGTEKLVELIEKEL